ncbi:thioredoxin family protein [bacterium]|nr:thioredoxin family protein [bacterium]
MGCSKREEGTGQEKADSNVKILQGEIIEEKEEVVTSGISEEFLREKTDNKTEATERKVDRVKQENPGKETKNEIKQPKQEKEDIKVTFIELGSIKCIPCRMMEPIIEEIKEEYAGQVKVIFYDVWTAEGRPYARKYNIRTIPTQVFLDKDGNEYFRHQGFFAKDELIEVLKKEGVK